MFFKNPKPQPAVDPVEVFNNAIDKAASTAFDFLPPHQLADLLHEAGQRYERMAAVGCGSRRAWDPNPYTPVEAAVAAKPGELARLIRGEK